MMRPRRDLCAGGGQLAGDFSADAPRGPGDKRDFAIEREEVGIVGHARKL